jgi:hypothetical protein
MVHRAGAIGGRGLVMWLFEWDTDAHVLVIAGGEDA